MPEYGVESVRSFEIKQPEGMLFEVNAADFGLSPENSDNTSSFLKALSQCAEHGSIILNIPQGVYYFENNECDNIVSNLENTVINGNDSLFVFRDAAHKWLCFENCRCVTVKNLSVDWDWSLGSIAEPATVIKNDTENKTVFLKFPHGIENGVNIRDYNRMSKDPLTGLKVGTPDNKTFYHGKIGCTGIENDREEILKISYTERADVMAEGEIYLVRHYEYGANAFVLYNCADFTFLNVNVWSVPGMAFSVGLNSHHFQLLSCKVTPKPDSGRYISSSVDCLHIGSCAGYWKVIDCVFTHSGDDCINIHDNIAEVSERLDIRTLKLRLGSNAVGDTLSFHTPGFKTLDFSAKVEEITFLSRDCNNSAFYKVRFDRELKSDIKPGCLAFNERLDGSHYVISGNLFGANRARGILLGCGMGTITDNTFYHTQGAAVMIVSDIHNSWCEGRGAENIKLCGNRFIECNASGWTSAVDIAALNRGRVSDASAFRKIRISGNNFTGICGRALRIASAADVEICNNYFGKINFSEDAAIYIQGNLNISLRGNVLSGGVFIKSEMTAPDNGFTEQANINEGEDVLC